MKCEWAIIMGFLTGAPPVSNSREIAYFVAFGIVLTVLCGTRQNGER